MYNRVRLAGALFTAASLFGAGSLADGAILYSSGGFESASGYVDGPLAGQPSSASANDQWGETASPTIIANVFTYAASTQQGVVLDESGAGVNDVGYWNPSTNDVAPYTPTLGLNSGFVNINWTEMVPTATNGNPFFGITIFDGSDALAEAGVDAGTGDLVVSDTTSSSQASEVSNVKFTPGTYYNLLLSLNYNNDTFTVADNGVTVYSDSFLTADSQFTDADLTGYNLAASGVASGVGYFDNYVVSAVPEPGSVALVTSVFVVGLSRKRKVKVD